MVKDFDLKNFNKIILFWSPEYTHKKSVSTFTNKETKTKFYDFWNSRYNSDCRQQCVKCECLVFRKKSVYLINREMLGA